MERFRLARFFRPSCVVLLFFVLFTLARLSVNNYDPTSFLYMGRFYIERDPQSPISQYVLNTYGVPQQEYGYDGQAYYYIALDPLNAWRNLDTTGRYARILFPLTVKAASLGIPSLMPYTIIIINILSITAGTEILSITLKRRGMNPWFSIIYGLFIGHLFVVSRDCLESFTGMMILLAIHTLEDGNKVLTAAFFFMLAFFAKEIALMFIIGYTFGILFMKNTNITRKAASITLMIIPYAVFQLVLRQLFGFIPILTVGGPTSTTWIPFYGFFNAGHGFAEFLNVLFMLIIPCLLSCLIFLRDLLTRRISSLSIALLLNALFIMFLPTPSFWNLQDYSRISISLVIAFLTYAISKKSDKLLKYSLVWILPFTTYFTIG